VGILEDDRRGSSSILREPDSIALAWGRIDGSVATPEAPPDEGSAAEVLVRAIRTRGPAGLEAIAADYAFARVSRNGRVFLARDAFGMRPLYWAREGDRMGFACHPDVLLRLGLITGDLDHDTIRRHLTLLAPRGERTAFAGLQQVVGGRWVELRPDGESRGRWFRPERVRQDRTLPRVQAAEMFEQRLSAAVASRARGKVVLSLSAGRDSGTIAVMLAVAGVDAEAITLEFEGDEGSDERAGARELAEGVGIPWSTAFVSASVTTDEIVRSVRVMGPTAFPAFPMALTIVDAAVSHGADVLMDGAGGEPLFSASPVVVVDLIRRGQLRDAATCVRVYDREWTYDAKFVVKTLARAIAPPSLLRLRERAREMTPWVEWGGPRPVEVEASRTARGHLLASILDYGRGDSSRLLQQLASDSDLEYSAPLLDLRLVDLALRLPDEQRAPLPHPKPVYAKVLGDFERSRVKARQTGYFEHLARTLQRDHPEAFDIRGVLASTGFVRLQWLPAVADDQWCIASLPLVPLSAWVQLTEEV